MPRSFSSLAFLLCVVLAASGCGGSSKPAVCKKRDDLKSSVNNLIDVNPVSDGVSEVETRLSDVQQKTRDLAAAAGDQFKPEVAALQQSTAKVASDVKALGGSDKASALGALGSDLPAVRTSLDELLTAVGSVCD
ncbi:MAG TPA: hypothetical protein VFD90_09225 [Gaiellales bacterium]|nr:hypothetical protein [Gaiellales bacterium]